MAIVETTKDVPAGQLGCLVLFWLRQIDVQFEPFNHHLIWLLDANMFYSPRRGNELKRSACPTCLCAAFLSTSAARSSGCFSCLCAQRESPAHRIQNPVILIRRPLRTPH